MKLNTHNIKDVKRVFSRTSSI